MSKFFAIPLTFGLYMLGWFIDDAAHITMSKVMYPQPVPINMYTILGVAIIYVVLECAWVFWDRFLERVFE